MIVSADLFCQAPFSFTHSLSSPNITKTILQVATKDQTNRQHGHCYELTQLARGACERVTDAFWGLLSSKSAPKEPPTADLELYKIHQYIQGLTDPTAGERLGLFNAGSMVLDGHGSEEIKIEILHTVLWQEQQVSRVKRTLQYLLGKTHLLQIFDQDLKCESLRGAEGVDTAILAVHERFWGILVVRELCQSHRPDCFVLYFQDAYK